MEQEFDQTKPIQIEDDYKFEQMAGELLSNWSEYKKMDSRMKLLDASCKQYMLNEGLKLFENSFGSLSIVNQNRRMLDRALIKDIEKYKVDTKVAMMFKSLN